MLTNVASKIHPPANIKRKLRNDEHEAQCVEHVRKNDNNDFCAIDSRHRFYVDLNKDPLEIRQSIKVRRSFVLPKTDLRVFFSDF